MGKLQRGGLEFGVDSNVHIQVVGPQNVITKTIDVHNKATRQLVSGILRFIQGEFTPSNKRDSSIIYASQAKKYIPCFIGAGTGGVILTDAGIPDYNDPDRYLPKLTPEWMSDDNIVQYTDTKLAKEIDSVSRYDIGVIIENENNEYNSFAGDIQQIVYKTTIKPNYYNDMYNVTADIFITELGLFASNVPNDDSLLARVIFKTPETALYIRPQDTLIIEWVISIIALNDCSQNDETEEQVDDVIANNVTVEYDPNIPNS